jgi:hypothetical protein
MVIPHKQRVAKEVQGALLGAALLLVVSSWLWLPQAACAYRLWRMVSTFRAHEANYRREASRAVLSPVRVGPETAGVGRLVDGSPIVVFPLDGGQDGYLHTGRPLRAGDIDASGSLILKSGPPDWGSRTISVTRTLEPGWYCVAREEP